MSPSKTLPAGRLRLEDYLDGVDDLLDAPWYADDIHIALDPQWWARAPVEQVHVRALRRTQRFLAKKHLATCDAAEDWPWVVNYRGQMWIIDGHHRAVIALLRDDNSLDAHVMHLADDGTMGDDAHRSVRCDP